MKEQYIKGYYKITVQGPAGDLRADLFSPMMIGDASVQGGAQCISLLGLIEDQDSLYGILEKLQSLSFALMAVSKIS